MEPYIATEKTFDEFMVLKKKGQKELDGEDMINAVMRGGDGEDKHSEII
jgi:hypothetical protein